MSSRNVSSRDRSGGKRMSRRQKQPGVLEAFERKATANGGSTLVINLDEDDPVSCSVWTSGDWRSKR